MSKIIVIKILLLFIIVSLIDLFFIRSTNTIIPNIYPHIKANTKQIFFVSIFWFLITLAIYFLIISKPNFNFDTLIKNAPLVGIFIFSIYSLINLYNLNDKLNMGMFSKFGIDILRGIVIVTFSCGIYYLGEKTIEKFIK
jgi:hypothetical protein